MTTPAEGVPEGPAATPGESPESIAIRVEEAVSRGAMLGLEVVAALKAYGDSRAAALAARLVEVERERDEALAREGDMFAEANHRMIECNDLRARASAAEGALRELAGAVRDGATGTRMSLALIAADLALSGLPPLTSETVESWALLRDALYAEGYSEMTMDDRVCQPQHHGGGCDSWPPHICECWVFKAWRALPESLKFDPPAEGTPTPAALVPKDAATPEVPEGSTK